ncbi:hypothetical protein DVH24_008582 [Malus domestica]|uniref:Uncharacterized protein n=1 Tax=Malus domestica TaxID=3750 RepID=A0A498JR63_MALDO|nr:hypothetical protein DVH24_008582 [Malus domestica]
MPIAVSRLIKVFQHDVFGLLLSFSCTNFVTLILARRKETYKCILPGYLHTDFDAAPHFLSDGVFAPKISHLDLQDFPNLFAICREMRKGTQELRRISKVGQKTKPS